jgi:5-formyltetrahydrofolate cyclo-ligase
LPIHERKEPDTFLFIEWLKQAHPHIKRAYPKADFADNTMQNFLDNDSLELVINEYGIPEPLNGTLVSTTEINMVIVPLLCFDDKGYRVGYGKGFYDRFMAACKPDTQFIGLSFFEPVDAIADKDEYDIALHQCITPDKIWKF